MIRLARLSIARPRLALLAWVVVAAALSLVGLGITSRLSPSQVTVPGTDAARAVHLADASFGPGQLVPVLLQGPRSEIDRQGPALVRVLAARRDTRVMSAWDGGPLARKLRPNPGAALIIASVSRTDNQMFHTYQKQIDRQVGRTVKAPVKAYITGTPELERGLANAAIDTTRRAELLAAPILFLVLLLLLRAPVAAALISAFALVSSLTGFGVVALIARVSPVAPIAVALGSMASLGVGVGFALLIHRRWAEEMAAHEGEPPLEAATAALETSGRAVLVGGTALVVAMVVAALIGPTNVLGSEGVGVVVCAMLGIGAAVVVMPAALVLLGTRLTWAAFPAPPLLTRAWDRLVAGEAGVVRGAVPFGAMALALMVVLAIPAASLKVGPPSPLRLPTDNKERIAYEQVGKVMGPGWVSPYNIVIVSHRRPLTSPALLASIDRLEARIARDRRVETVVGPGVFQATSKQLGVLPVQLRKSTKLLKGSGKDLGRLEAGLGKAGAGTKQLQGGLQAAAAGAGQLQSGSGAAQSGAGQLRDGLAQARAGGEKIAAGLREALNGAQRLRTGAGDALAGSQKITGGLGQAVKPVKAGAPVVKAMAADVAAGSQAMKAAQGSASSLAGQIDTALSQLQGVEGAGDARASLQAARDAASGLASTLSTQAPKVAGAAAIAAAFSDQVQQLSTGLAQLYAGSTALTSGIGQLRSGNASLASGIDRLASGGGQLTTGLGALQDGATRLESGLGQLTAGTGQLGSGISSGIGPVGTLTNGLATMRQGVATFRSKLPSTKDLERLNRESPGLFSSGYFVLAAIAGAPAGQRQQARFAVNLDRGGNAGQILIVPTSGAATKANEQLGERLRGLSDQFAKATNTEVALGGQAAQFGDFKTAGAEKIWPVVWIAAGIVALLLMAFLRTVMLPLVSVLSSLLATAVAFGALQVTFGGSDPVLGGPGSFSPVSIIGIFAAALGITTILQVVTLARAREHFVAGDEPHTALRRALFESAPAATGAAAAMVAAMIPFAASSFLTVAQFGLGLVVAVLADALIVRPVLLPAIAELLGRTGWWPTKGGPPAAPQARGPVSSGTGASGAFPQGPVPAR